jgi:NADH-quinone oxidoreductase subunit F
VVEIVAEFMEFFVEESCGYCTPCRVGNVLMKRKLDEILSGHGEISDLDYLVDLGRTVKFTSRCGLGQTSPNPVLTSLKYFREEYEAHIKEKRCPAGVCRALTAYYIDLDKCARGCDACVGSCPVEAIFTTKDRKKGIDQTLCVKCGECMVSCPSEYNAVRKVSPPDRAPIIERPVETNEK